jgi:hypothetical protein
LADPLGIAATGPKRIAPFLRFAGRNPKVGSSREFSSAPTDGISASDDQIDEICDSKMHGFHPISWRRLLMGGRCVPQDAYDLTFWKNVSIIQGQEKRFANRKGGMSSSVRYGGHGFRLSAGFLS